MMLGKLNTQKYTPKYTQYPLKTHIIRVLQILYKWVTVTIYYIYTMLFLSPFTFKDFFCHNFIKFDTLLYAEVAVFRSSIVYNSKVFISWN